MTNQDESLKGNEKIETAIAALQQEPSDELLAHTLTVIRRRMKEQGQFILAVEPAAAGTQINVQAVKAPDGTTWWAAFTSFDEELKGSGSVMSTFLTDIRQLFEAALKTEEIRGVILNPWNRTLMLDKGLIGCFLYNKNTNYCRGQSSKLQREFPYYCRSLFGISLSPQFLWI